MSSARPVMACSPLYPPVELIHAVGFHPLVLWELADLVPDTQESDKRLQPFCCSVARRMTEYLFEPHDNEFAGYFYYNACDTIRNLPEIIDDGFREQGRPIPSFRFHLPAARLGSDNSRVYLATELNRLGEELSRLLGVAFSEDIFRESVALYGRLRKTLLALEDEVQRGALSFADYVAYARQSQRLPVEEALPLLEKALASAKEQPEGNTGVGVLISGILPPPDELISILEAAGFVICANDVASLHRSIAHTPDRFTGLEDYYQQFYENHFPCPTLLHTADQRVDVLLDLVRKSGAQAVVFVGEKFCEYEFFEHPYLTKRLNEFGIATLVLEFAIDGASMEAQKTRIEALAELLVKH